MFKLINSLKDPRLKQEYFVKLKDLTFKEEEIFPEKPFGDSDMINNRPSSNISSLVTTRDLQAEVNNLKKEVRSLHDQILDSKTKDLDFQMKTT